MEKKVYKKSIETMRLARFLAQAGVASRRKAEDIVKTGRVKINGKIVVNLASQVSLQDKIELDGKILAVDKKVYYLLNKPKGYVSSVKDPHNPKNILSLVPKSTRVFPVGRLDKDSQGLIILTNDGDFAYQLTHPKFLCQKNLFS
ncbi:MAG: S4 domain-containing protein [Patescibacteria group bacterium]|nr:S4 domain-containing protein [Patescibacteria group bacterium]